MGVPRYPQETGFSIGNQPFLGIPRDILHPRRIAIAFISPGSAPAVADNEDLGDATIKTTIG